MDDVKYIKSVVITECTDKFEEIDEFDMPLKKDAWLDLDITRELELLEMARRLK